MKTSIVSILFGTAVVVLAAPSQAEVGPRAADASTIDGAPEGYRIVPMTWTGPIFEGAEEVTLEGTAQEIVAQIEKLNPDYQFTDTNTSDVDETDLEKRSQAHIICNVGGYGKMFVESARRERDYLRSLGSRGCGVDGGPGTCARVSCSNNDGIWLCNDNRHRIAPACNYLGNYVDEIIKYCASTITSFPCSGRNCPPPDARDMVRGQQFDTDGYNVMVGKSTC